MPFVITKNNFDGTLDVPNLTQNRNFNLPNASGNLVVDSQLSAVALSGSYNDLSNKPNFPESSITSSGSTYIRLSDGTQIVFVTVSSSTNNTHISFPLPFRDTKYSLAFDLERQEGQLQRIVANSKTTSGVNIASAYLTGNSAIVNAIVIGKWK